VTLTHQPLMQLTGTLTVLAGMADEYPGHRNRPGQCKRSGSSPHERPAWRERWPPLLSVEATAHALAGLFLAVFVVTVVAVLVPAVMVVVMGTAKETTSEDVRD